MSTSRPHEGSGDTGPNHDTELNQLDQLLTQVFAVGRTTPPDASSTAFDRELWSTLADLGLTRLTGAESDGGSGAGWPHAARLLMAAGRSAARIPVAENDLLAGRLREIAGLSDQAGPAAVRTVAVLDHAGHARHVPWASSADSVVTLWESSDRWFVADVPAELFALERAQNTAGEPRDHLRLDLAGTGTDTAGVRLPAAAVADLELRGALARSLMMVGAMERISEIVVEHTGARTQFGRSLGRFQAVQHMVADIAAETALARAATEAAVDAVGRTGVSDNGPARFAVAAAKSCAGHAAAVVVRHAHQCLGAIGFTLEHELHRHTSRLLAWRTEFGSTRRWDEALLTAATAAGHDGLWPLLTAAVE